MVNLYLSSISCALEFSLKKVIGIGKMSKKIIGQRTYLVIKNNDQEVSKKLILEEINLDVANKKKWINLKIIENENTIEIKLSHETKLVYNKKTGKLESVLRRVVK